jgi:dipeptidyl aminopeptidase/acylaminoacyl peptidase
MRKRPSRPAYLVSVPLLWTLLAGALAAQDTQPTSKKSDELTLEKLFPKKSFFGPSVSGASFSHDGRYAAWLWKPYVERRHGNDLWLLEVQSGTTTRVTDAATMARFQASARKVEEDRAKKSKEAAEKKKGEAKQAEAKKDGKVEGGGDPAGAEVLETDADDEKAPRYSGISNFRWSPKSNEMLFQSEGDIYRYEPGQPIARLTMTQRAEASVQWLPDGSGYTHLNEGALLKVTFGSERVQQIDPKLPAGETMSGYRLSDDGRFLVFLARKGAAPNPAAERKVAIATYRDRFAKVNEVSRQVSDDPFPEHEVFVYLFELPRDMVEDGEPGKIFTQKVTGPRDMIEVPEWSPDSRKVVFAAFDQATSQVRVLQAEIGPEPTATPANDSKPGPKPGEKDATGGATDQAGGKPAEVAAAPASRPTRKAPEPAQVVYRFLHDGGPTTPRMIDPQFLADSRHVLLLTEQSGFRHLHVLDPLYQSARQLTAGTYEVYPVALTKDKKTVFATATKEHPSRLDIYAIDVATGDAQRVSKETGEHDDVAVSPDGKTVLCNFVRYGELQELVRLDRSGTSKVLTKSHPDSTRELVRARPEFFSYPNRHGHEIHGFLFKPDGWSKADKRPLLVYVYGGPLGTRKQVVDGSYHGDAYFFAWYMAKKHGYVTVTIDPRGMSGYGGLFEKSNFEQVGKPQVEDLVDGVKFLVANYGVDPKRAGMHGWSFGGFQTQMCLYTEPDVFACGIAGAGPTEWENYNKWYSTGTVGPTRTGQPDLQKFSLLPLSKNLKSKLLLVHGMEDSNVLFQDTVRVYRELLKAGKETLVELFVDPTGGHALGGDVERVGKARKYEEFLLRCLGRGEPSASPSLAEGRRASY